MIVEALVEYKNDHNFAIRIAYANLAGAEPEMSIRKAHDLIIKTYEEYKGWI